MLPTYERLDSKPVLRIPFGRFAFAVVSLPLGGFIFCVVWSLMFDFEAATGTHCRVPNLLPSISAAIGNYQPQRTVWQLAISAHFLPRLMVARTYLKYFEDKIRKNRRRLGHLAVLLNVIENISLLGLSLFTSAEDYKTHRNCFVTFIATSEVYMLLTYFLNKNARKTLDLTWMERKSLRFKRDLFILNVVCFALAGYFFVRHNDYCEPGIYTFFAFFEYIVVFTNMGYHMTAYWDFCDRYLLFDKSHGFYFASAA